MARNPLDIYKFIQAATNLAKRGVKESDILNAAKREFGEVNDLLKIQIRKIFKDKDAPSIKNPNKQPGEVIEASFKPGMDKRGKVVEESPSQASGIMQRLEKQRDDLFNMLNDNPYRSGGPLDPKMGLVRTAARQVLQKLAREGKINIADEREAKAIIEGYQGGVDPIEVFKKTFGQDTLNDLSNLGDELIEIENRGGSFKEIKKILDDEGFFNLTQPENPPQGMTPDELDELKKEIDQEDVLKKFDPEDREPNSMGGINRVNFRDAGKVLKLASFFKSKGTTIADEIRKAVDNIFASGDSKYDADVAVDSALEEYGVDREMFDQMDIINAYDEAYQTIVTQRGLASGKIPGGTQVFKDSEGGIKGITMGGDKDFQKAMSEAMEKGMRESENMKRLGLDPSKMDDALKYDEMKEAGQLEKNVTGSADLSPAEELRIEFPGITDELVEDILTDTNPQRIAEVKQTMREAMEMEKKGMSVDEIINTFKNQKRTKQANGGLSYLMGM